MSIIKELINYCARTQNYMTRKVYIMLLTEYIIIAGDKRSLQSESPGFYYTCVACM